MSRVPLRRRRRRLQLVGGSALLAVLLAVTWLFSDELRGVDSAGTMGSESSLALGPVDAAWEGAALDGIGDHSTPFSATFEVFNPSREDRAGQFSVYFSRDDTFDATQDCRLDDVSVTLPGGGSAPVTFRATPRAVSCLDAGPWKVALLDQQTQTWTELPDTFELRGAEANLAIAKATPEVGSSGTVDLRLSIARKAGSVGVPGLWEHEAHVWLRKGDDLCVLEADPITLARNSIAHASGTWTEDEVAMRLELGAAQKVSDLGDHPDPFRSDSPRGTTCEGCRPPELAGRCALTEGEWEMTAEPSAPGFRVAQTVFVHAPPVSIEVEPIEITLGEGDVGHAALRARNFSRQDVRWSSAPADPIGYEWLVGMSDQRLRGRKARNMSFTISAADLGPGRYSGEFLVTMDDFYRTEVRVPVELTVVASRAGVAEDPTDAQAFAVSNYPNPFSSSTTIQLEVEREGRFTLAVYDIQGREVATLLDDWLPQGRREVRFEADDLASGTYLYRLSGDGAAATGTMSLVK